MSNINPFFFQDLHKPPAFWFLSIKLTDQPFSNNLHAYVDVLKRLDGMKADHDPYLTLAEDGLSYTPPALVSSPSTFDEELQAWFREDDITYFNNEYLSATAVPMRKSWHLWKQKDTKAAHEVASLIEDRAWRKACTEWLERRM